MQALAMKGKVYLMGAGPGDTDLLTVKAVHVLRAAEVVLHDDLQRSHNFIEFLFIIEAPRQFLLKFIEFKFGAL